MTATRITRRGTGRHGAAAGPGRRSGPGRHRFVLPVTIAAGVALLFLGYLRVSWTVAATSDGAAQSLQARDMLAGNWLLSGWTLSDVSFYSTELPEYVLVELIRPLGTGVIHAAAAITYTLLVLTAALLARGRARGRAGLVRGAIAAGIMLAPQPGYGAFVLLLSPDHVGTQVPLLLGWLLLDRAPPGQAPPGQAPPGQAPPGQVPPGQVPPGQAPIEQAPRRWWGLAALCLLLTVVQFADRVALLTAVLPLVLVCGVRVARRAQGPDARGDSLSPARPRTRLAAGLGGDGRFELALGGAAIGSVGLAWAAARVLAAAGGFAAHPFPLTLAPLRLLWTHTWLTGWGVLELYGANFLGVAGWAGRTFAAVHLIGLAWALAGFAITLAGFLRGPDASLHLFRTPIRDKSGAKMAVAYAKMTAAVRCAVKTRRCAVKTRRAEGSLVDSVLAVAIVANVASYLLSVEPGTVLGTGYDAREIAAVLPYGAVLAGRVFGARIAGPRWGETGRTGSSGLGLAGAGLGLVLGAYGAGFGYAAAGAAVPGRDSVLAGWLVAHGLRYGLGGAEANVVTVDSGGRVVIEATAVRAGRVRALRYQSAAGAYDPRRHDASFLVARAPADGLGYAAEAIPDAVIRASFGRPARTYRFDGFTVAVWNVNLLTKVGE